jgi:exo-beta-1,3-glucanase (GH17 family)
VSPLEPAPLRRIARPLALFGLAALGILAFWWRLGAPIALQPAPPGAGHTLQCVSYAPFRGTQSPLVAGTHISVEQIEGDLAQLSKLTGCARNYSVEFGLDQIPAVAKRHGMKVMQGIWLSSDGKKNAGQIVQTVALTKQFPDVIESVIVGNEVLLRGEMSAADLLALIRAVKSQVAKPVTYADVWEFWLRNPELAAAVDFITIHILPYWEDLPIPVAEAASHVNAIRQRVAAAFPGKEIVIGEFGWPSQGRMREGALPSPVDQARALSDVGQLAAREKFRMNVIEAYDQPWKRALEGTVGGHWGVIDSATGSFKFRLGEPVSNHPHWRWNALGGIVLAALVFAAAWRGSRGRHAPLLGWPDWIAVTFIALVPGALIGWAFGLALVESLGLGGWVRSLAMLALAAAVPIAAAAALASGRVVPGFAGVLANAEQRERDGLTWALGLMLVVLAVVAVQVALGLVFDPRYKDFPFAPLTAATVPFLALSLLRGGQQIGGKWLGRAAAETAIGALLAGSAVYIAINETFANWQSVWLCAVLLALAVTLARAPAGRN